MFTRWHYPVTHIFAHHHQSSSISSLTHRLTCSVNRLCWKSAEWPFPTNGISLSLVWEYSVTSDRWLFILLCNSFPGFLFASHSSPLTGEIDKIVWGSCALMTVEHLSFTGKDNVNATSFCRDLKQLRWKQKWGLQIASKFDFIIKNFYTHSII